ncbi:MAG TPA: shikimate dehydrogenase [Conexibacter sp.]
MPICGVLGWPVRHSRSPAMHEAGYRALGLDDWRYQLLPVPPELFEETVRGLPGAGFVGANVTIPHKEAALALADAATDAARAIGAANTLTFRDGRIHADNTDAPGLLDALPFDPAGRTAVVMGAGGSARAVVWALLSAGAAEVLVWNRTSERAERLCAEIGGRPARAPLPPADLLVNTTSVGLQGEDPFQQLPLSDAMDGCPCLVDLVYGNGPTALVSAAQAAGATVVDGLEILVRQGARSFAHWTGRPAPLEVLRAAAREAPAAAA